MPRNMPFRSVPFRGIMVTSQKPSVKVQAGPGELDTKSSAWSNSKLDECIIWRLHYSQCDPARSDNEQD